MDTSETKSVSMADVKEPNFATMEHDETARDALQLAIDVEEIECKPFTKNMFRLYGCMLVCYFCGCLNGYDGSLMGGLNAMSSYQDYFNMWADIPQLKIRPLMAVRQSAGSSTGFTFAIYNIGSICAIPFTGPTNDFLGRRWGMFMGAAIIVIGTCVQAPAINRGMFLGGRFILGFGVSFCSVSA